MRGVSPCYATLVEITSDALDEPVSRDDLDLATTHCPGACCEIYGYPEVFDTRGVTRGAIQNTVLDTWTAK